MILATLFGYRIWLNLASITFPICRMVELVTSSRRKVNYTYRRYSAFVSCNFLIIVVLLEIISVLIRSNISHRCRSGRRCLNVAILFVFLQQNLSYLLPSKLLSCHYCGTCREHIAVD